MGGIRPISTALGILLAGGRTRPKRPLRSIWTALGATVFKTAQKKALKEIDKLFEEDLDSLHKELRAEPAPKVTKGSVYLLKHKDALLKRMETKFGKEVGYMVKRMPRCAVGAKCFVDNLTVVRCNEKIAALLVSPFLRYESCRFLVYRLLHPPSSSPFGPY